MRAVIYARVSSAAQRDRDTIASQLRVLPEFVARQGWTLVRPIETYVDDGHTAKSGHLAARLGLAAMLRDAALGVFDVVVVVDIDRITRSEDLAERGAILGALQRAGIKLASATSGQVLDLSTSTGDLFTTLHAFFAAEWTRKHRERVIQGKITGIQRNRKPSGKVPYGIAWDKITTTWSLDPTKAPIVLELLKRVAAGESCRAIADDFHRREVARPRGPWTRSRAQRIVRARYTIGEWLVDKGRKLIVKVPPIADEDLWQRAQNAMDTSGHRGLRKTKHEYLLEGLGVCSACGAPIGIRSAVWDPRRNGRWSPAVYQCRSRRTFRLGDVLCRAPHVTVGDADARVWDTIVRRMSNPSLAREIAGELAGRDADVEKWQHDAEVHRVHLVRLERVEGAVLDRYRRGLISDNSMDTELEKLRREREAVRSQLATADAAISGTSKVRGRAEDALRVVTEIRAALRDTSFEVRRKLVELLVTPGSVVFNGKDIHLTLAIPREISTVSVARAGNSKHHESSLKIRLVA